MEDDKNELFQIKITETGIFYIRKLFRISGAIYFATLLVTTVFLIMGVAGIIGSSKFEYTGTWDLLRAYAWFYFLLLISLGNLIGVTYYVKFSRTLNKSIVAGNEDTFNKAFRYIFRNAVVFLIVLIINLISAVFSLTSLL